jgi:hypothetical protein
MAPHQLGPLLTVIAVLDAVAA